MSETTPDPDDSAATPAVNEELNATSRPGRKPSAKAADALKACGPFATRVLAVRTVSLDESVDRDCQCGR
jgi:hypothetical protein